MLPLPKFGYIDGQIVEDDVLPITEDLITSKIQKDNNNHNNHENNENQQMSKKAQRLQKQPAKLLIWTLQ